LSIAVNVPASTSGQPTEAMHAAVAAYKGLTQISDSAFSSPHKDWSLEVKRFAAAPVATKVLDEISDLASTGLRSVGHISVSAVVTSVRPTRIDLRGCIDTSGMDIIDASGHSVKAASGPGAYWRYIQTVSLIPDPGSAEGWVVSDFVTDNGEPC
jgi:hypothetical protein